MFFIKLQPLFLSLFIYLFSGGRCDASSLEAASNKQKSFQWVFGDLVNLDPDMIHSVLAGKPGERYYVDQDRDGKPEEVWFIDGDPRHSRDKQPILVRVIDEDGDLRMGKEPDHDSDLYVADWNADGIVDVLVDYEDQDGDQDVDRMGIYFYDDKCGLRVWWSCDDGDDNLLWYDSDYSYEQKRCENHTHFGGDESFVSFCIKPGENHWTSFFENPFLFFDRDRDGVTEEVIRVLGEGSQIHSLRWSFDVDNDATKEQPRDFDVSISAYPKGWSLEQHPGEHQMQHPSSLTFGKEYGQLFSIRGFPAGPVLKRNTAAAYLRGITWERVLLAWDENDLNIAWTPSDTSYTMERWEGVIAAPQNDPGYEMPGIGWPDCGPFNKRYELVRQPEGPNEYYFNPSDHRIHLKNSDKSWIKVDYNYDNEEDMYYSWTDTDHDGFMDKIAVDFDKDGKMDDSWCLDPSHIKPVQWTFGDLNTIHAQVISNEPKKIYLLNKVLFSALERMRKDTGKDPVWKMIEDRMRLGHFSVDLSERLIHSDESMLYYLTISADWKIAELKKLDSGNSFWKVFDVARSQGDAMEMSAVICRAYKISLENDYEDWLIRLRTKSGKSLVAWDNTWLPPNWGWESEKAAFRCYDGHFDLFGKRFDKLIFPAISNGNSYHLDDNGWGMDILHVGKTGGCGGLVLYIDDVAYPVRNEKKSGDPVFSARLLKETNDTVTIEFKVTGVGPKENPCTVYIRPSAIAGRPDSPVEVFVHGGNPDRIIKLGIVLNVLPQEDFFLDKNAGVMGLWGFQQPEIGWIGTGIIFPASHFLYLDEQADEHRVVLKCKPEESLHYQIQGDWLRGHRFSCCPGTQEWLNTLKETAGRANL